MLLLSHFSHVRLFATLWTVAHQAPPSMGFSRQEYWSGVPFLSPGDLPDPGIKPRSPALQADALTSAPPGNSGQCEFYSFVSDLGFMLECFFFLVLLTLILSEMPKIFF